MTYIVMAAVAVVGSVSYMPMYMMSVQSSAVAPRNSVISVTCSVPKCSGSLSCPAVVGYCEHISYYERIGYRTIFVML